MKTFTVFFPPRPPKSSHPGDSIGENTASLIRKSQLAKSIISIFKLELPPCRINVSGKTIKLFSLCLQYHFLLVSPYLRTDWSINMSKEKPGQAILPSKDAMNQEPRKPTFAEITAVKSTQSATSSSLQTTLMKTPSQSDVSF